MPTPTAPRTFAEAEVILAQSLPGYSPRPPQQLAARAVEQAIEGGYHLLVEAPTASGKTLLTGIPAILSGKRVVISTATKALQSQVANKDLPFLAEHLGVPFTFAVLKGRSNYACRVAMLSEEGQEVSLLPSVIERADSGEWDGTLDELGLDVSASDWSKLTVTSEECPGKKNCPWGDSCFSELAKERAQQADIVVVNHALLLTELVIRELTGGNASMLGHFDVLIADEAHEIESYAINAFTQQITQGTVNKLSQEVTRFAEGHGMTEGVGDAPQAMLDAFTALWIATGTDDAGKVTRAIADGRIRPSDILSFQDEWVGAANSVRACWDAFRTADLLTNDSETDRTRRYKLTARLKKLSDTLISIITESDDAAVRWVETEKTPRGGERQAIKIAPIEVGPILHTLLFAETPSILVSATIAVDGSMDFIADQLGVGEYESLIVDSPFDYQAQARLYVPPRTFPLPSGKTRDAWESLVIGETLDLIRASRGRAMVLFTSTKQMRAVHATLAPRIEHTVLMQGESSTVDLAARFAADESSVLFATRSFFTGIDIPGNALSLVIIDKLPFPVPTDPMFEAKCELITRRGGNEFMDLTIPTMSLTLAQGFGRLIRSITDTGVVAILDPRLVDARYGAKIRKSIPDAPLIRTMTEVEGFFAPDFEF